MVIADFDVARPFLLFRPLKTYSPSLVNTNAELPYSVAAQRLKAVTGQEHQVDSIYRRL
jgi:hypothetical protein